MFSLFKKEEDYFSPVDGKIIELSKVPDKVFANKMMGDGVAFEIEGDTIFAPCDGVITFIPDSLHAIGITTNMKVELLIHVGLDTVELNGEGFTKIVQEGKKVKKEAPLIRFDKGFIESKGFSTITPMIVTNGEKYVIEKEEKENVDKGKSLVMKVFKT